MYRDLPTGPQGERYVSVLGHKQRWRTCLVVADIDGTEYYVTRRVPTQHGWDIIYGIPLTRAGGTRPPMLILTPTLRTHMQARATIYHSGPIDLPICEAMAVRLRRRLGIARKTGVRGARKTDSHPPAKQNPK